MKFNIKAFWYKIIGVKKYIDRINELSDSNDKLQSILSDREDYIISLENTNEELKSDLEKVKKEKFVQSLRKYM